MKTFTADDVRASVDLIVNAIRPADTKDTPDIMALKGLVTLVLYDLHRIANSVETLAYEAARKQQT